MFGVRSPLRACFLSQLLTLLVMTQPGGSYNVIFLPTYLPKRTQNHVNQNLNLKKHGLASLSVEVDSSKTRQLFLRTCGSTPL